MGHLFLSYTKSDRALAERLASGLREAGVPVGLDLQLLPGGRWLNETQKAADDATALAILATSAGVRSPRVRDELAAALRRGTPVIPIFTERVSSSDLPTALAEFRGVSLVDGFDEAVQKIAAAYAEYEAPREASLKAPDTAGPGSRERPTVPAGLPQLTPRTIVQVPYAVSALAVATWGGRPVVAFAGASERVDVLDLQSRNPVARARLRQRGSVGAVALVEQGGVGTVLTGSDSGAVEAYYASGPAQHIRPSASGIASMAATAAAGGPMVAWATDQGVALHRGDLLSGEVIATYAADAPVEWLRFVTWRGDPALAVATRDRFLALDLADLRPLVEIPGPRTAYGWHDPLLVLGGADGMIELLDAGSGRRSFTQAHEGPVGAVAAMTTSAGENAVVSAGAEDRRVRLWRLSDRELLAEALVEGVTHVEAVPGGRGGLFVTGAADGTVAVWTLPGVRTEPAARAVDQVEWVGDAPATQDALNRRPVARMIEARLRRLARDGGAAGEPSSFLIHLDGRWGSGKSSILNFLREDLESGPDPWMVVDVNAWQQARLGPAWWTFLTALRHRIARDGSWWKRSGLRIRDAAERAKATGAPYAFALVLIVALVLGLLLAIGPGTVASVKLADAKTITAVLVAAGAIWAGALIIGRFMLWDSPTGARLFEHSGRNPMLYVRRHFSWLVAHAGRPVVFFVDDLDRCEQEHVVELLDGIQTLVRDTGGEGVPGPYFVVAADGRWIRASYEEQYKALAEGVQEPGQALGYLFLDKLFQLTVTVPALSAAGQASYVRGLLEPGRRAEPQAVERARVEEAISQSRTQAEVQRAWSGATAEVRDAVAPAAVAKLTEEAVESETEHELQRFAALLDPNPRRVKRFLNMYTVEIVTSGIEQHFPDPDELALWTILRIRWPRLADHLRAHPEAVECVTGDRSIPDGLDGSLAAALTLDEVRAVMTSVNGGPLTTEGIRRLAGKAGAAVTTG